MDVVIIVFIFSRNLKLREGISIFTLFGRPFRTGVRTNELYGENLLESDKH